MTKGVQVDIDYVVRFCESLADKHKIDAAYEDQSSFSSVKDKAKRDSHLAKSMMADEIANHFRNLEADRLKPSAEVDDLARQVDPETFARHEAMVRRLITGGADESYAMRMADDTYGELLADARERAAQSIQTDNAMSADTMQDFASGVDAVIGWHERRALEQENAAGRETISERKAKYLSRAKRHRLYAKHILQEFQEKMATRRQTLDTQKDERQPTLPFPSSRSAMPPKDEGVPIEVQRMFLKKGEVFDDEGHAG